MSNLHETIATLTETNTKLIIQNKNLTLRLKELQEENDFLSTNAQKELELVCDQLDKYTEGEELRRKEMRLAFDQELRHEREI